MLMNESSSHSSQAIVLKFMLCCCSMCCISGLAFSCHSPLYPSWALRSITPIKQHPCNSTNCPIQSTWPQPKSISYNRTGSARAPAAALLCQTARSHCLAFSDPGSTWRGVHVLQTYWVVPAQITTAMLPCDQRCTAPAAFARPRLL